MKYYYLEGEQEEIENIIFNAKAKISIIKKQALTDYRTIFDYDELQEHHKLEFIDFFKEFISGKRDKSFWDYDSSVFKASPSGLFAAKRDRLYVVTEFDREEPHQSSRHHSKNLVFAERSSSYAGASNEGRWRGGSDRFRRIFNQLRLITHDIIVEEGLSKMTVEHFRDEFIGWNNTVTYNFNTVFGEEIFNIVREQLSVGASYNYAKTGAHNCNLSEDEVGKVTMINNGREVVMKAGKGIRKLLIQQGISFDDEGLKRVVSLVTMNYDDYEFSVVSGSEITENYLFEKHDESIDTGSLDSSCMKHQSCQGYFGIYEEHAELLTLKHKDTGLIAGRCLLWDGVVGNEEDGTHSSNIKLMDRVYGNEKVYPLFFKFAIENGLWRKRRQCFSDTTSWIPPSGNDGNDGEGFYRVWTKEMTIEGFEEMPYMDTFYRWDNDTACNDGDFGYIETRNINGSWDVGEEDSDEY